MRHVALVGCEEQPTLQLAAPRSGGVDVTLRDGRTVSQFTKFPPGSPENPVDQETLAIKARDLIAPVLGAEKTDALIKRVNALEAEGNMRDLVRSLMTV